VAGVVHLLRRPILNDRRVQIADDDAPVPEMLQRGGKVHLMPDADQAGVSHRYLHPVTQIHVLFFSWRRENSIAAGSIPSF
jgi:hypothetical protein